MTDGQQLLDGERVAVEQWFVKRGLPNLIHGYNASTDVFTRAVPLLLVLWLFGIVGAYGDRFEGWSQAFAAFGAAGFLLAVAAVVNRIRGRSYFQIPDRVGGLELAAFVLAPAVLPIILDNASVGTVVSLIALGIVELLIVWFAFGFGLGYILIWAVGNLFRQLSNVFALMVRSLPLLLVFTMFLFMNAELWQVASDFTRPLFFVAAGGLVAVAAAFILFRIPEELEGIGRFDNPTELERLTAASGAPIDGSVQAPASAPELTRAHRWNVAILTVFSIGVQIALVMVIVGLFYLLFGMVTVRPTTIEQWTAGGDSVNRLLDLELFGSQIPITTELVKVTGFLMAFTALQFTVSALTDAGYRKEFFDDLTEEIRETLAVRVVYLNRIERDSWPPEQ